MFRETHVLIVEDDDQTRELLASVLNDAGYRVSVAADVRAALVLVAGDTVDVVLSDIRLRDESGIALLAAVRARPHPPEVVMLTGYASIESSVAALRTRAFDYLQKPVATAELLSAIARAAQQRHEARRRAAAIQILAADLERALTSEPHGRQDEPALLPAGGRYRSVGQLTIDYFRRTVTLDGAPLHLTPIEYALVGCLAETPGRVVASGALVERTHGYEAPLAEAQALLRGHVRNLRRKLPEGYLVTARGTGYMIVAPEPPA